MWEIVCSEPEAQRILERDVRMNQQSDQLDWLFTRALQTTPVCTRKHYLKLRLYRRAVQGRLYQNIERDILTQRRIVLPLGAYSLIPTDIRL